MSKPKIGQETGWNPVLKAYKGNVAEIFSSSAMNSRRHHGVFGRPVKLGHTLGQAMETCISKKFDADCWYLSEIPTLLLALIRTTVVEITHLSCRQTYPYLLGHVIDKTICVECGMRLRIDAATISSTLKTIQDRYAYPPHPMRGERAFRFFSR